MFACCTSRDQQMGPEAARKSRAEAAGQNLPTASISEAQVHTLIDALRRIADESVENPAQVASAALLAVDLPAPRFHVPLVRSISAVSAISEPAEIALVRTSSQQSAPQPPSEHSAETDTSFSVEAIRGEGIDEDCVRCVTGLRHDQTLASLVEGIHDAFDFPGDVHVQLSLLTAVGGDLPVFGEVALDKSLASLNISQDARLHVHVQLVKAFSVAISGASGNVVTVEGLLPDMNVASLVNAVEQELGLVGDEVAQLVVGTRPLDGVDLVSTLRIVGIDENCTLMYFKQLREKGRCPTCHMETSVLRGVSIGAQHEGWGRKWNTDRKSVV